MFGLAKIQHPIGNNKLFLFIYQYFMTKGDIPKQVAQIPRGACFIDQNRPTWIPYSSALPMSSRPHGLQAPA